MAKQSIGEFLATLRKANGYTQQEIADRLGISNRTLSGWECDKVLPDILLLPALAEIYGVTVDEILAGERKERNEVALSRKAEKRILKSKIARFVIQSYILVGIIVVGILLSAFCSFVEATSPSDSWSEILLTVGVVAVVICIGIFFAFWKSAELSVDNTTENFDLYCLILRKKLSSCLYVLSATSAFATIGTLVGLFVDASMERPYGVCYAAGIVCVSFAICAVSLFLTAWLLYKQGLTNFGGEPARQSIRRDRKYFRKVGFGGLFPLVVSVVLLIVTACGTLTFTEKTTIYENSSVDKFVEYMETIATPDGYRHLPLSELAKTARNGEKFDLGDGYFAVYHRDSFTVYNEMIELLLDGSSADFENLTFSIEVPRIYLIDDDDFYFFNARYYWCHAAETGNSFHFWFVNDSTDYTPISMTRPDPTFVRYDHFIAEKVGDGMAYVREIVFDYSMIGYYIAIPVIEVDLIVCATLCALKRSKFSVKL